ncbi:MAG: tetratricopeptide repeat protein, partial [Planctomycetota bacterium]
FFSANLHQFRREVQAVLQRTEALIQLATERGFPLWKSAGTFLQGWALVQQGQGDDGIAQMRQGLDNYRAMGVELFWPYAAGLLTEAYGKVGRAKEGLPLLAEALAVAQQYGERCHEAELYRLKGELLLLVESEDESDAEACFRQAIEIARRQQAKSWELRAAMSLSWLWQKQGKKEEAQTLLQEIYCWFKEGFDTADLQDAKMLLEALS